MESNNNTPRLKKRYTVEEKQNVFDFMKANGGIHKRGIQKLAAQHFGISTITVSAWVRGLKKRAGRKPGSKNVAAPAPLPTAQPADLRRLAAVLEEIAELEAQTAKLEALRIEAAELKLKLTSK